MGRRASIEKAITHSVYQRCKLNHNKKNVLHPCGETSKHGVTNTLQETDLIPGAGLSEDLRLENGAHIEKYPQANLSHPKHKLLLEKCEVCNSLKHNHSNKEPQIQPNF